MKNESQLQGEKQYIGLGVYNKCIFFVFTSEAEGECTISFNYQWETDELKAN